MASSEARVAELEKEICRLRSSYSAQLREIAAAAGLREANAVSLCSSARKQHVEESPNVGPGSSVGDTSGGEGEGASPPPRGAVDGPSPNANNKLNRWLSRASSKAGSTPGRTPGSQASSSLPSTPAAAPSTSSLVQGATSAAPASVDGGDAKSNKLGRWLARMKEPLDPAPLPEQAAGGAPLTVETPPSGGSGAGKLGRWLQKSKAQHTPPPQPASAPWPQEGGTSSSGEDDEGEELMSRIRDSLKAIDGALSILSDHQSSRHSPDGDDARPHGPLCPQCRGEVARCESVEEVQPQRSPQPSRSMGMRVEETHRGLSVSHVVPGGPGEEAGIEVLDIIKLVNGRPVKNLRDLGATMKVCAGGSVTFDVTRGRGSKKQHMRLVSGPGSPQEACADHAAASGSGGGMADAMLSTFLKGRREDKGLEPASPPAPGGTGAAPRMRNTQKKYNKYGKDTQLWVPASDDGAGLELPSHPGGGSGGDAAFPKQAEAGGFFMFPPGHPDYVPLPPGEAALIAGRSDVHPNERLAPHWSHIIFKAPSGAEIRAQARHATYGTIEGVAGKLVNAEPITAHCALSNCAAVRGNIVYVKRGSAPFTKKAREAVAAGALACVVANSDRETFGMSYTDDGIPFESLNIPCVMISSDIASKLEVSEAWSVTLVPARPDQQGSKKPPQGKPNFPEAGPEDSGVGMCQKREDGTQGAAGGGMVAKVKSLPGLEGLPITPKPGVNYGKPGKKPTMWKKIKLLLP